MEYHIYRRLGILRNILYDRQRAVSYARAWALGRNPLFYNFTGIGGDCTNFISQCLFAGSCIMNRDGYPDWYYLNSDDRAPAWTGVEFLHSFLLENGGAGPFGREVTQRELEPGDIIQLGNSDNTFYHTLIVSGFSDGDVVICAHTDDSLDRPLSSYFYAKARFIHIEGVRVNNSPCSCFEPLILGRGLICTP